MVGAVYTSLTVPLRTGRRCPHCCGDATEISCCSTSKSKCASRAMTAATVKCLLFLATLLGSLGQYAAMNMTKDATGEWCYGSVVKINNELTHKTFSQCKYLLGSLELYGYTPPPKTPLSIEVVSGYLSLNYLLSLSVGSFTELFPNLKTVQGNRTMRGCAVFINNTLLSFSNRLLVIGGEDSDDDADDDDFRNHTCQDKNPFGKSGSVVNIHRNTALGDMIFPWNRTQCPTLVSGSYGANGTSVAPLYANTTCSSAYDCANITGGKWTNDQRDLPCDRTCDEIIITSVEKLCELPRGCRHIDGNLIIITNGGLDRVPYLPCMMNHQSRMESIDELLEEILKDVETITGQLAIINVNNLKRLDFFNKLTTIGSKVGRDKAVLVIRSTSLTDISRMENVSISGSGSCVVKYNYNLCNTFLQCGKLTREGNGILAFCQNYSSTVTDNMLSWEPGNTSLNSSLTLIYQVLAYEVKNGESDDDSAQDICIGSPMWTELELSKGVSNNALDLSEPSKLQACSVYEFVICYYTESNTLEDLQIKGIGWARPNMTYTVPGTTAKLVITVPNSTDNDTTIVSMDIPFQYSKCPDATCPDVNVTINATQICLGTRSILGSTSIHRMAVTIEQCRGVSIVPHYLSTMIGSLKCNTSILLKLHACVVDWPSKNQSRCRYVSSTVSDINDLEEPKTKYPVPDTEMVTKYAASSASFVLCIILVIVVIYISRKRRKERKDFQTKLSMEMLKCRQASSDYIYGEPLDFENYVEDPAWELVPDSIALLEEVGEGAFGKVYRGILATEEDGDLTVAIKTLTYCDNVTQRNAFLLEASIMKKFDSPYVMKLMGLVSTVAKPMVVMEFMGTGDLRAYLIRCRPEEQQFFNSRATNSTCQEPPDQQLYKLWALQLAKGMVHLNEKHFVHRDLAARNCILSSDLCLKIGDFGLTRDIYESDYYRKQGRGALPVRWMGPESLRDGVYVAASDAWSFGVVLWEMATLGDQPYPGKNNEEVMQFVVNGSHMDPPIVLHVFPDVLYRVMEKCWTFVPANRPNFEDIVKMLEVEPNDNRASVAV